MISGIKIIVLMIINIIASKYDNMDNNDIISIIIRLTDEVGEYDLDNINKTCEVLFSLSLSRSLLE